MNALHLTKRYYEKWLDIENGGLNKSSLILKESEQRKQTQMGYSKGFDVYMYISNDISVISYRSALSKQVQQFASMISSQIPITSIIEKMGKVFAAGVNHSYKFYYAKPIGQNVCNNVRELKENDYLAYLRFYLKVHEQAAEPDWLKEYYLDNIVKRTIFAYCNDKGEVLSCTDGPDMPYLKNKVQTIGINTLLDHRGNGYASRAVLKLLTELRQRDICPMWSCNAQNAASEKLAMKVGFEKLADVLTISGAKI